MSASLQLEVVTPNGAVLNTEADYIGIPGVSGQFGVMSGHIPLLSALAVGNLYYRRDGKQEDLFVAGGFAEISDNHVRILAESAELKNDIDIDRASRARKRAEERLGKAHQDEKIDVLRAQAALKRAVMRLHVAGI